MTRFIGLTGGIGAGKSEALAAFERLGVPTLSTDRVAHDVLDTDDVRALLIERWGEDVLGSGGDIDRDRVAAIVFERPDELKWLESQTHPRVGARVAEWRAELDPGSRAAVVEVPLLFESGMEAAFDATVAVVADDAVRERRLGERGQAGLAGREERQFSQGEKTAKADHTIQNDGTLEELEAEVKRALDVLAPAGEPE